MTNTHRCPGCLEPSSRDAPCPVCSLDPHAPYDSLFLAPGTLLHDTYAICRCLGHGGFGITYLAWDRNLRVKTAIKEYLPGTLATRALDTGEASPYTGRKAERFAGGLRRFLDEARTLALFQDHPGIVTVRDYFEENRTAYCVMQFLEGMTLRQFVLKRGGTLDFPTAFKLMMPVLDALREVHGKGLLHRDVSPDNIYVTTGGRVKILDFGAARQAMGEPGKSLSVILKPGYAPEEQYRSKGAQGPWTDVYGVAATLYRILTGQTPPEALDRMKQDDLAPPSRLGVSLPPLAESALLKALAVDAVDRFQSIDDFQQALIQAFAASHSPAPTPRPEDFPVRPSYPPARPGVDPAPEFPRRPGNPYAVNHAEEHDSPVFPVARVLAWVLLAAFGLTLVVLVLFVLGDLLLDRAA